MEAALKAVFNVHRNVVRGLRKQLQQTLREKDELKQRLYKKCQKHEEEIKKLKEEISSLQDASVTEVGQAKDLQTGKVSSTSFYQPSSGYSQEARHLSVVDVQQKKEMVCPQQPQQVPSKNNETLNQCGGKKSREFFFHAARGNQHDDSVQTNLFDVDKQRKDQPSSKVFAFVSDKQKEDHQSGLNVSDILRHDQQHYRPRASDRLRQAQQQSGLSASDGQNPELNLSDKYMKGQEPLKTTLEEGEQSSSITASNRQHSKLDVLTSQEEKHNTPVFFASGRPLENFELLRQNAETKQIENSNLPTNNGNHGRENWWSSRQNSDIGIKDQNLSEWCTNQYLPGLDSKKIYEEQCSYNDNILTKNVESPVQGNKPLTMENLDNQNVKSTNVMLSSLPKRCQFVSPPTGTPMYRGNNKITSTKMSKNKNEMLPSANVAEKNVWKTEKSPELRAKLQLAHKTAKRKCYTEDTWGKKCMKLSRDDRNLVQDVKTGRRYSKDSSVAEKSLNYTVRTATLVPKNCADVANCKRMDRSSSECLVWDTIQNTIDLSLLSGYQKTSHSKNDQSILTVPETLDMQTNDLLEHAKEDGNLLHLTSVPLSSASVSDIREVYQSAGVQLLPCHTPVRQFSSSCVKNINASNGYITVSKSIVRQEHDNRNEEDRLHKTKTSNCANVQFSNSLQGSEAVCRTDSAVFGGLRPDVQNQRDIESSFLYVVLDKSQISPVFATHNKEPVWGGQSPVLFEDHTKDLDLGDDLSTTHLGPKSSLSLQPKLSASTAAPHSLIPPARSVSSQSPARSISSQSPVLLHLAESTSSAAPGSADLAIVITSEATTKPGSSVDDVTKSISPVTNATSPVLPSVQTEWQALEEEQTVTALMDVVDGDVTVESSFQRAHETSGQDITLISQDCSEINPVSQQNIPQTHESKNIRAAELSLADSFDRMPVKAKANRYAYIEVVRKQGERRKLKGYSCTECKEYYTAAGLSETEIAARIAQCSRHRARQTPPRTPEHFWSVGFPDSE